MAEETAPAPRLPARCALCDDEEPLMVAVLETAQHRPDMLAVCAACYLDLTNKAAGGGECD